MNIENEKKSLKKKRVFKILFGTVELGVGSSWTESRRAPVGYMCAGSVSFLCSSSTLNTTEFLSD